MRNTCCPVLIVQNADYVISLCYIGSLTQVLYASGTFILLSLGPGITVVGESSLRYMKRVKFFVVLLFHYKRICMVHNNSFIFLLFKVISG